MQQDDLQPRRRSNTDNTDHTADSSGKQLHRRAIKLSAPIISTDYLSLEVVVKIPHASPLHLVITLESCTTVAVAKQAVIEKEMVSTLAAERQTNLANFGLFHVRKNVWLSEQHTLQFYRLRDGDIIELRQNVRDFKNHVLLLKIQLPMTTQVRGGSRYHEVQVPPTCTVRELIAMVSESMTQREGQSTQEKEPPPQYGLFVEGVWIENENMTLQAAGVRTRSSLQLRIPYYEFLLLGGAEPQVFRFPPRLSVRDVVHALLCEVPRELLAPSAHEPHRGPQDALYSQAYGLFLLPLPGRSSRLWTEGKWLDDDTPLHSHGLQTRDLLVLQRRHGGGGGAKLLVSLAPQDPHRSFGTRLDTNGADPARLDGEAVEAREDRVMHVGYGPEGSSQGTLVLTNYRLLFVGLFDDELEVEVPLAAIARIERSRMANDRPLVLLETKEFRLVRLAFCSPAAADQWHARLSSAAAVPLSECFALRVRAMLPGALRVAAAAAASDASDLGAFSMAAEYRRLGLAASEQRQWRVSEANARFELCRSYPELLVVPVAVDDDDLRRVAAFRSQARIPVLTWRHPLSAAVLCRSSQPKVGVTQRRCREDEKLVAAIRAANRDADVLVLLDARPFANAVANAARGAGFETTAAYPGCKIEFLGIPNIHTMRESGRRLHDVVQCFAMVDEAVDGKGRHWWSQLEATGWLDHIRAILSGARRIVGYIDRQGTSVLLHCSDGWDRTPQLSAIAQLCLDPYYRSFEGFAVLVAKEWLSFGHKFADRHGCGARDEAANEQSPIFLQFADCCWQLLQQYPCAFEFNESFLVDMVYHSYSCRFGTFLYNNDAERSDNGVSHMCPSFWSWANARRSVYRNVFYEPDPRVIYPLVSARDVQLWRGFYFRHYEGRGLKIMQGDLITPYHVLSRYISKCEQLEQQVEALKKKIVPASSETLM